MVKLAQSMSGDHPGRPALVLSNLPGAGGLQKAADMGIATEVVDHRPFGKDRAGFETALQAAIAPYAIDVICLAGFMRVLTEGFVSQWDGRMLNIHPSLLPKYKGLHTHARAIEAGDTLAGCTVHEVTPALDDGPILGQAKVPVRPGDTPDDLAARVLVQEHQLYPAVLRRFLNGDKTPVILGG
jgi:phosphoribosylglycinamide formyltransferase-1